MDITSIIYCCGYANPGFPRLYISLCPSVLPLSSSISTRHGASSTGDTESLKRALCAAQQSMQLCMRSVSAAVVRLVLWCGRQAVRAFTLSPGLAAAHVLALDQLSAAGSPGSRADGWARGVLAACEEHLGRFVDACGSRKAAASDGTASADWQTMMAIFTAGEVGAALQRGLQLFLCFCWKHDGHLKVLSPSRCRAYPGCTASRTAGFQLPYRHVREWESLAACICSVIGWAGCRMLVPIPVLLGRPLQAGAGCVQVVLLRQAKPSGRLVVLVQALTAPKLASLDSSVPAPIQVRLFNTTHALIQPCRQANQDIVGVWTPPGSEAPGMAVQAHAWVALGKICLTDEATAKKCLPRFIQELGRADNPAVKLTLGSHDHSLQTLPCMYAYFQFPGAVCKCEFSRGAQVAGVGADICRHVGAGAQQHNGGVDGPDSAVHSAGGRAGAAPGRLPGRPPRACAPPDARPARLAPLPGAPRPGNYPSNTSVTVD